MVIYNIINFIQGNGGAFRILPHAHSKPNHYLYEYAQHRSGQTSRRHRQTPNRLAAKAYTIIFEAETPLGRQFDLLLLIFILLSVAVVFADSVESLNLAYGQQFRRLEWLFTLLFTCEYLIRLLCVRHPLRYATSFFGIVDLLSILPTYLALLLPEMHSLIDVRLLRLLRIFRILGLSAYSHEYYALIYAIRSSARKIIIFISFVMIVTVIMGTIMYLVEGRENGYTSIPTAVYWAITTMTTVGYGDISPSTPLGRLIASFMMLMGWGTLAVPTGIVTVELGHAKSHKNRPMSRTCPGCMTEGHLPDARYCRQCGEALPSEEHPPSA